MNEFIDKQTLDDFYRITSYNVEVFINTFTDFAENDYPNISNFFSGSSDVLPTESLYKLKSLISEKKKVTDVIILNSTSLENYKYWVLVDKIESIGYVLESANNISKWSRSASTKSGYRQQVIDMVTLSQGQTLQDVERKLLASSDPDSWALTAIENSLAEDDYTLEGGQLIKAIYKNNNSLFLEGVVDNIDAPEKTYGLDIDQNITIDLVTEDLKVLSYQNTLLQSMKILTNLNVEDDPDFPSRGLKLKGTVLGGNVAGISYPIIFRDLALNFATDDSFKSVTVIDIRRDQDGVYLDFNAETRVKGIFSSSVRL